MAIDYALAKREHRVLKGRLTRAKKKGPEAVLAEVEHAEERWAVWGAAPDDWHRWDIAKRDAYFELSRREV